jgi:hypothetical protein
VIGGDGEGDGDGGGGREDGAAPALQAVARRSTASHMRFSRKAVRTTSRRCRAISVAV